MSEKTKKECGSCKKKGLNKSQWGVLVLSSYMFVTSIYGTYILVKRLIELFY